MFATLCQICKSRPATIHLTAIEPDGSVAEIHLSTLAVRKLGLDLHADPPDAPRIRAILAAGESALEETDADAASDAPLASLTAATGATTLACPDCGLSYGSFVERNRFGCAGCYRAFAEHLDAALQELHGADRHVGRRPTAAPIPPVARARRRAHLEERLERAVADEHYEEAARLRDLLAADAEDPR